MYPNRVPHQKINLIIIRGFLFGVLVIFLTGCGSNTALLVKVQEKQALQDSTMAALKSKMKEVESEMLALRDTYDEDHKTMEDLYRLNAEIKKSVAALKKNNKERINKLETAVAPGGTVEARLLSSLDSLQKVAQQQFDTLFKQVEERLASQEKALLASQTKLDSLSQYGLRAGGPGASVAGEVSTDSSMVDFRLAVNEHLARIDQRLRTLEQHIRLQDSSTYDILSQLVLLENKIISLTNSFNTIISMTPSSSSQPTSRGVSSPTVSTTSNSSPVSGHLSVDEYRQHYIDALSLYQARNFREAIKRFENLLAVDRNNELADNAQYWIGECYYGLEEYEQALNAFRKVFNFPGSNKLEAAQFKIAYCYLQLGQRSKARQELEDFLRKYPNSEYVSRVRQMLQQL